MPAEPPRSRNLAARMGCWSANHWKTAVFGWLALVALSVFISMNVPTTQIKQQDAAVGESAKAARIIEDAGFNKDAKGEEKNELMELVLLQSDKLPVSDPAFRAARRCRPCRSRSTARCSASLRWSASRRRCSPHGSRSAWIR
jgi:RND superfamily putative drug exporter